MTRAQAREVTSRLAKSRDYDSVSDLVGPWSGEQEFAEIAKAIEARRDRRPPHQISYKQPQASGSSPAVPELVQKEETREKEEKENEPENAEYESQDSQSPLGYGSFTTPPTSRGPPDSALLRAPLSAKSDMRVPIPAFISGRDDETPTPTPPPAASP